MREETRRNLACVAPWKRHVATWLMGGLRKTEVGKNTRKTDRKTTSGMMTSLATRISGSLTRLPACKASDDVVLFIPDLASACELCVLSLFLSFFFFSLSLSLSLSYSLTLLLSYSLTLSPLSSFLKVRTGRTRSTSSAETSSESAPNVSVARNSQQIFTEHHEVQR